MENIFDTIVKRIDMTNELQGDTKRLYKFRLPRMCGSSTWMAKYANELAEKGFNVLYIEHKAHAMEGFGISEKVTVMPQSGGYQYWLHKLVYIKTPFDWIICDNLGYPKPSEWFVSLIKQSAQKSVLWIDTVEGELIKFVD